MAIPAYMWLKDDQGSEILGSVQVAGRTGSIEILEYEHNIYIPTDNDTGELTGTRKHSAITIVKTSMHHPLICSRHAATGRNCNRRLFVGTI